MLATPARQPLEDLELAGERESDPLAACVSSGRDGCVVDTAPLSAMVREFEEQWRREHSPTFDSTGRSNGGAKAARDERGHFAGRSDDALTPPSWVEELEQRTQRLDRVSGQGLTRWQIYSVRDCRHRSTELRIADPLATALRRTDAFRDGEPPTLDVRPNPKARPDAQAACCGGSLTGSQPEQP